MPIKRIPWLNDEIMEGSRTIESLRRVTMIALFILIGLGLFAFMGA